MAFNISYIVQAVDKFSPIAKRVAQSVDKVNDKFTGLSAKMAASSSGMKKVGESTRRLGTQFASLGAKVNVSRDSIKKFGVSARKIGRDMTLFASTSISFLGFSMVKAASDAAEAASKFNTVFRSISGDANFVAKNLARNYGLARTEAKVLLGSTGDLLTGFGFSQEAALDMSRQVQELAVDLASFTNFSGGATGASEAITKALLGERESIKSLGKTVNEKMVQDRLAIFRTKGLTFETDQQAKAFATLQLIQEQSKTAIGDQARTSEELAGQTRILNARILDFKVSFGKVMIPLALKVVNALEALFIWLDSLSPSTKKWTLIIAGLVAVVGPLLIALGMFAAALAAIGKVGAVVIGVVIAIGGVVTGVIALFSKFRVGLRSFSMGLLELIHNVGNALSAFIDWVVDIFTGLGKIMVSPFVSAFKLISLLINKAGSAAKKIASFFGFGNGGDININQNVASTQPGVVSGGAQAVQANFNGRLDINGAPPGSRFTSTADNMANMSVGMNMAGAN
jgi:hypothetical protein